jgi:hypothetical protein
MEPEQNTTDLKSQILTRIETEAVCPHSRLFFGTREYTVWTLWFLTAIFGALSVAVSLFVVLQRQYSFYEVTHENFLSFAIEMLPYLWISIFILMILFAVYNLRHTKTGYRYPLWQIFGSSLVLSLAGGTLLHMAGVGFALDHQIGMFAKDYQSQEKMEQKLWQKPSEGRLVGTLIAIDNGSATATVLFEDITGVRFETNVTELGPMDIELLKTGQKVRLLGQLLKTPQASFHACAVFPWFFERNHSLRELSEMRREMREKVFRHMRELSPPENIARESKDSLCANMPIMRRFEFMPAQ